MRCADLCRRACRSIGAAGLLFVLAITLAPAMVLAASPDPSAVPAGDPRSSGQGPGLVGDPLTAVLVVAGIGVVALLATLAYVRFSGGPHEGDA